MGLTDKKRIIVVLGMHRSGTSAITRSLTALGVELGDRLMPAKPDNEKGFWEDLDLYALNIELLHALGHEWNTHVPIDPQELMDDRLSFLKLKAVELLRRKTQDTPIWGIKDPRMSRLLPFWKSVFASMGFQVSYLLVVRHPTSVASSLKKRNGLEPEKSYYLWLDHTVHSVIETADCNRIVVDYDLFMDHPEEQLSRIAKGLDLPVGEKWPQGLYELKRDFLDTELRHTRFREEDLRLDPSAPPQVIDVYALLRNLATDELQLKSPEVQKAFMGWAHDLQEITPALRYMTLLEKKNFDLGRVIADRDNQLTLLGQGASNRDQQISALTQAVRDRDQDVATLTQAVRDRDQDVATLTQAVRDRDRDVATLTQAVWDRDRDVAALTQAVRNRDRDVAALTQAVRDRDRDVAALTQAVRDRDHDVATLTQAVRDRDHDVATLTQAVRDRDQDVATLTQVVHVHEEHIDALDETVSDNLQYIDHLDRTLSEREKMLADLNRRVSDQATQINALLTSRSWRMTAPLRSLGFGARAIKKSLSFWRNPVKQAARYAYRRLPLSLSAKWRLRSFAFRYFGSIFGIKQVNAIAEGMSNGGGYDAEPALADSHQPATAESIYRILEHLNQPALPDAANSWPYSRFMLHLWKIRPDLQQALDLNTEEGRKNFSHWYLLSARHEYGLPASAYPNYVLEGLASSDSGSVRKAALELLEADRAAQPDTDAGISECLDSGLSGANLIGYARGEFGMGEHVRMVARACAEAGAPFTVIDFAEMGFHGNRDQSVDAWISVEQKYATNVFHINADSFPPLFFHYGPRFFANRTNIGYWAWELAKCPEEFDLALGMVDEVWAISDFVRESFQQRSPVPVVNMPLAVSLPELKGQYDKKFFDIPEDCFAFLFTFDAASYLDRKNPVGVVQAFRHAFPGRNEKVCLILKTMNAQENDPLWKQLRQEIDGDERIHLITSRMTRDEILGLNSVCDAFVSLHRSEGFGRCIAESMLLGKPVIATNYSGSRDFAREGTACVVDYRLVPIQEGRYPCWRGQVWADPDIEHAAWFMRKLVNDAVFREYIARAGQDFIRKNFNEKTVGEKYAERLMEIAAHRRSQISATQQNGGTPPRSTVTGAGETIVGRIDLAQAGDGMPCLHGQTELAGWAMAGTGVSSVEVFMDGQLLGQAHYGMLRPDVGAVYPDTEGSTRSGFFRMLDTRAFRDGMHRLEAVVSSRSGLALTLEMQVRIDNSVTDYDAWLEMNFLSEKESGELRDAVERLVSRPLLSLVTTALQDPESPLVQDTLNSLRAQIYPYWELVVSVPHCHADGLRQVARRLGIEDRMTIHDADADGLEQLPGLGKGSYVGMLDWGDRLDPKALFAVANTLNADPSLDIIYTDEDRIVAGKRVAPFFKPAWSPSLFDDSNYIGRLWFVRKSSLPVASAALSQDKISGEHDLLREIAGKTRHVAHIPMVLYSRNDEGRQNPLPPPRRISGGDIVAPEPTPLVSVIIPTCLGDLGIVEKCLASLFERTAYDNLEVILVANNYADTEIARTFLSRWPAKVLHWEHAFNWSAINNFGAAHSRGEYLLFMNDDIEVIGRDWLESMIRTAAYPGTGAVGATLRYPNGTLQHAGIFLVDHGGGARHAFRFCTGQEPELQPLLGFDRECTAVTGACLLTSAAIFRSLGGFDEALPLVCNDTDYCLRLQAENYRCLLAANTELVHHEGISRAGISETADVQLFWERWGHLLKQGDPYMNPNLAMSRDDWTLNPEARGSLLGRRSLA